MVSLIESETPPPPWIVRKLCSESLRGNFKSSLSSNWVKFLFWYINTLSGIKGSVPWSCAIIKKKTLFQCHLRGKYPLYILYEKLILESINVNDILLIHHRQTFLMHLPWQKLHVVWNEWFCTRLAYMLHDAITRFSAFHWNHGEARYRVYMNCMGFKDMV